jgi:hypothetical protein
LLTPLQVQIAEIVNELPESEGFALAGAGALLVHGLIDRATRDLDYFTTPGEGDALARLRDALEQTLDRLGLGHTRKRDLPTFVRIEVSGGDDRCEVDLAVDYRALPAEPSQYGPTLAVRELAANKVLAVFGRAEARDVLDLAALTGQFELREMMELASEKDPGFDTPGFLDGLSAFHRLSPADFGLEGAEYERLRATLAVWRNQLERELGNEPLERGIDFSR